MANLKASIKDIKKSRKKRDQNLVFKSSMKKSIKEFKGAVSKKEDPKKLAEMLKKVYKVIDKNCKKKTIHKNNAARKKSRLTKMMMISK